MLQACPPTAAEGKAISARSKVYLPDFWGEVELVHMQKRATNLITARTPSTTPPKYACSVIALADDLSVLGMEGNLTIKPEHTTYIKDEALTGN
jgi:hypothetical protein